MLLLSSVPAFADDMPDASKTPGAILGTVPDDQVASCLSDKTGTNVQVDDPITVSLICTPGYSKCIRNELRVDGKSLGVLWLETGM